MPNSNEFYRIYSVSRPQRLALAGVWAKGLVARIDTAYSEEGLGIQMMISQPFQF
jgi:hypothetical protein